MTQFIVKVVVTALIVATASEVAKRSSILGAIIVSLPLTSLLAFIWLYVETGDTQKVAALSRDIFWLVLVSLPLFLVLPMLLRTRMSFWVSLGVVCAATVVLYLIVGMILRRIAASP